MRTRLLAALVLTAAATTLLAADRLDSYVYKRANGSSTMKINGSLGDIKSIAKRYGNEFIWAKEGNRQYVVKDAGVLAEARTVFAKLDALEAPMEAVEKRLQPHTDQLEKLSEQLEELSDRFEDEDLSEASRDSFERKMHAIEKEMKAVEKRMEGLERELERTSEIVEKHAEVAEKQFEDLVVRAIRNGKAVRVQ